MAKNIYYCVGCGKIHAKNNFYKSHNPHHKNGVYPFCKKYIKNQVYTQDGRININKFKELLRQIDEPFLISEFMSATQEKRRETIGAYFSRISMKQYRNYTWEDSVFEESVSALDGINDGEYIDDFVVTPEIRFFWGDGLTKKEYFYLTSKFTEYVNTYECNTPAMKELLKQAAFESLEIHNKRQKRKDVSKNLKNLQNILGSANIKPVQETGANATEQATFGTLIKKWENEKPIPEPLDDWKKKDWIKKYVVVWFFGHLCKMLDIPNPFADQYEEEVNKYTVESSNASDGD